MDTRSKMPFCDIEKVNCEANISKLLEREIIIGFCKQIKLMTDQMNQYPKLLLLLILYSHVYVPTHLQLYEKVISRSNFLKGTPQSNMLKILP